MPNPAIANIVVEQKQNSFSGYTPEFYYSALNNTSGFIKSLGKELKRYIPSETAAEDDSQTLQRLSDFWKALTITGEQFHTLPDAEYFDETSSIAVLLETLDCVDARNGIHWKKSVFHNHDFFEIIYVYQGHCSTTSSRVNIELSAGDFCLYNLQAVHQIGISSEEDAVFCILIKKDLFQQVLFQLQSRNNLVTEFFLRSLYQIHAPEQRLVFRSQENPRCEVILQMIIEEAYQKRCLSQDFLRSMLSALLTELFHNHLETINRLSSQKSGEVNISQVIAYIGNHLSSVTLEQTANHFGYTTRSMIRYFKKHTNSTFRQILLDLRMKQAADMLRNCSLSIQEIAAEIGYTNRSYFHKCFQEYHGMTPAAYRQTHKISLE